MNRDRRAMLFVETFESNWIPMRAGQRGKRRLTRTALAAWLVTASVGALFPAWASVAADFSEVAKLLASDGAAGAQFGHSVAVAGNTAVVGAPGDDNHSGAGAGAAYVLRFDGMDWVEEAKLTASDGRPRSQASRSATRTPASRERRSTAHRSRAATRSRPWAPERVGWASSWPYCFQG